MPAPLVGSPFQVTIRIAMMVTIMTKIGRIMLMILGLAVSATLLAATVPYSSRLLGLSSSPVLSARSSAFFIGPKSTGAKQEIKAKTTAMMQ